MKSKNYKYPFLIAVFLYILFYLIFGVLFEENWERAEEKAFVSFINIEKKSQENKLFVEQSQFEDSEPIFFPTKWNASEGDLPQELIGDTKYLFKPLLDDDKSDDSSMFFNLKPHNQEGIDIRPDEILLDYSKIFSFFGKSEPSLILNEKRELSLHINNLLDREKGLTVKIDANDLLVVVPSSLWSPLELLLFIDTVGKVYPSMLISSTGDDLFDEGVKSYIEECKDILSLPPGYYQMSLSP